MNYYSLSEVKRFCKLYKGLILMLLSHLEKEPVQDIVFVATNTSSTTELAKYYSTCEELNEAVNDTYFIVVLYKTKTTNKQNDIKELDPLLALHNIYLDLSVEKTN